MFPLSFSSSSSLSSIPPSLDSISELDRGLSDISEDDDLVDDGTASHALWGPLLSTSSSSPFCDLQFVDVECLAQNPQATPPLTSSSEGEELDCQAETRATAVLSKWQRWFFLRAVVKCVSLILCFLTLLGKKGNTCLPTKLVLCLTKKLSILTLTVPKLVSKLAGKLRTLTVSAPKSSFSNVTTSKLTDRIFRGLAMKLTTFMVFFTRYLPAKFISLVPAFPFHPPLPCLSSLSSHSSFIALSSLPAHTSFSYLLSVPSSSPLRPLSSISRSLLISSLHRYLLNPSPFFLPCLLVLFLLVVMLTASQSLALALVLATPLGLTLCYLECMASGQRKALLPMFVSATLNVDSGFSEQDSPLTPEHTPPRIRHYIHTSAGWTQETCDPAA